MTDLQTSRKGIPLSPPTPKLPVVEAAIAPWRVFRQRPWPFIGLAFLPVLASLAVTLLGLPLAGAQDKVVAAIVSVVTGVTQYAVQLACQNASIHGSERILSGTSFTVGGSLGIGFRRLLPVVGMSLLAIALVFAGLILLIIPGLIAIVALVLATPACVIEGLGPVASIKRSFALSKGNRWRLVGVALIGLILPFTGVLILSAILAFALAAVHLWFLAFLPLVPLFLVFGAVGPIMLAVLFVELRSLKEGGPRASIARVFD